MKKTQTAIFAFILFFSTFTYSQQFSKTANGVNSLIDGINVNLEFYSPEIVRITKYPEEKQFIKTSLSVIKKTEQTEIQYEKTDNSIFLTSSKLKIELNLKTGRVCFYNLDGNHLLSEKDYGIQFTPVLDVKKESFLVRQAFMLEKDETIYGLGQQQNGKLNQRGQRNVLKQENMKVAIPFFQSIKGYGVFWDNYAPTTFTDNLQELSFESLAENADYYFMYGGNAESVISNMRDLTGNVPMIPLWGFGYLQSKERYKTQDETVGVIEKYRNLKIPIDAVIQDWRYWGNDSNWNAMSFDPKSFPRPQDMVDKIHNMNAHLMIVAWPGFGPKTEQYKEFMSKKMMINFDTWPPNSGTKPYDVYNPEARAIYWDYLNKGVFSKNTDAWWLDSTEPDHINIKPSDFDQPTFLGSYNSVLNAFPLEHIKGIFENQRKTTSEKRVFILTRSAFAGQQRYGSNTWSGDVIASWETLQKQIPAALNFTLTGLPYWNADIGGFFLWNYKKPLHNVNYQELYVRWLQFGAFTPMMRSHGTDAPREIYQFGKKGDWAFDAIEKYIHLRYHLLPYIYSTAWSVTSNSGSFMRALMMDFAADKKTHTISDEYLFGYNILVAPVIQSMYVTSKNGKDSLDFTSTKKRAVYLPKGSDWFDFWTGEKIQGGMEIQKEAAIDLIPLYIKAGSILPFGPKVQYSDEKKWDQLEIRIYQGADGKFTLYEDEKNNYNYEKGIYSTINFKWNENKKTLEIQERQGSFPGMLKNRTFNIVLVSSKNGISAENSTTFNKKVKYNGKAIKVKF